MNDQHATPGLLPPVVVGCMRATALGDGLWDFVRGCLDLGLVAFDHAPVYGEYGVEELFGDQVLRRDPRLREEMVLVSKAGIDLGPEGRYPRVYYDSSPAGIRGDVESSLRRLGTDRLDLLLVHRPDPMTPPAELAATLDALVQEGKVRSLGVSNCSPVQVDALQRHLANRLVAHQVELSLLRLENLDNGVVDHGTVTGAALMAWSPLAGGAVFDAADPRAQRVLAFAEQVATDHASTVDAVLYAWLWGIGAPVSVVTGSMRIDRIRAAVQAQDLRLSHPEWYGLMEASRGISVP